MVLQELEPTRAALTAQQPDRADTLISELKRVNASIAKHLDGIRIFTEINCTFYDLIVLNYGNHTIIAVVDSLETLWASYERQWV